MRSFTKSPALLSFSPELQRNIWLELSPGRLIGMALVILLMAGGVYEIWGERFIYPVLGSILWILLILWGTRLAVETVSDEIIGHTWDVQRLSAQNASGLILAKLAGGAIYTWYGALLCIIGIYVFAPEHRPDLYDRVLEGVMAQSMAMFAALVIARFGKGTARRVSTLGAQFIGIVFAGFFSSMLGLANGDVTPPGAITLNTPTLSWYGMSVSSTHFWYATEIMTIAWIIFGMIRLMRRELGYRDGPLGWTLFVAYMMIFVAGTNPPAQLSVDNDQSWQSRIFLSSHMLTYVALLGLPVAVSATRKLALTLKQHNWQSAWASVPPWMPSAGLMLIGAIIYASTSGAHAMIATALAGFVCRDVIVVYGARTRFVRRSEQVLVLYFSLVYLFSTYGISLGYHPIKNYAQGLFMQLVSPFSGYGGIGIVLPWLEALLAYVIFRKDFHQYTDIRKV